MSFQTEANEVLAKARRVDEIAEELHGILADLEKLDRELWAELKLEGGTGQRGPGYVDWVALVGAAKREITTSLQGGQTWTNLPTMEDVLRKAWGCLLVDDAARNAVEGR